MSQALFFHFSHNYFSHFSRVLPTATLWMPSRWLLESVCPFVQYIASRHEKTQREIREVSGYSQEKSMTVGFLSHLQVWPFRTGIYTFGVVGRDIIQLSLFYSILNPLVCLVWIRQGTFVACHRSPLSLSMCLTPQKFSFCMSSLHWQDRQCCIRPSIISSM